jgi:hypothetical protein
MVDDRAAGDASDGTPGDVKIPIPKLPPQLKQLAHAHIRQFAVSMIISERDDSGARPCAATLVIIDGRPALLTARHVWEKAKTFPILVLLLSGGPYRIETSHLSQLVAI